MNYIFIIKTVISLLPTVIEVIKAIEEAIPDSGQGDVKLKMVRGVVEAAYDAADDAVVTFDKVWPSIQTVISTFIEFANSNETFKK